MNAGAPHTQGRTRLPAADFDALADERERWVEKSRYYYDEIERLARFAIVPGQRVLEIGSGLGDLLAAVQPSYGKGIDVSARMVAKARQRHPHLVFETARAEEHQESEKFDAIIVSDVIGHVDDVWATFSNLRQACTPSTRLFVSFYNFLWEPVLRLGELIGRKTPLSEQNWLSASDLRNLLQLSGFEVVSEGNALLMPVKIPLLSSFANQVLSKMGPLRNLSLVDYLIARPEQEHKVREATVSVVIPCRNEKGNIADAVERTPELGSGTELVFVDGNSDDGTVEAIEEQIALHPEKKISLILQGEGKGKGDAVRKGFAAASGEVLMILDADLTVPPEDLPKFYSALVEGRGELVSGSRLVYPLEAGAMRLLNIFGNKFFSYVLTWILDQEIRDTLCGTKVLTADAYRKIAENRSFFGDFDPFGDFDLIFGAAKAGLKIREIPVRYKARTYGETKISRFRHGFLLLKMTAFALRKFKLQS
jgi:SAM-dependent methyltransferase